MLDNHFIILVTVYNAEKYIGMCLDSALSQRYKNYEVIVIDDCSTDNTWRIIRGYANHCKIHRNEERAGDSLINTIWALKEYPGDREDIIAHLDGDDWLAGDFVLLHLNNIYDGRTLITYGQFEPASHRYHNYCTPIPDTRTYRRSGVWRTSHLKTWKRWLWDMIKDEDFRFPDGRYLNAATDNAFMYPMIEMAGNKRTKFIDKVLYIYNDLNQANYMKERPQDLINTSEYIRSKPIYDEL